MACIPLWSSAVRVHDSQAYRKMDVTRQRISRILELREILLSVQTGFSLVNAAVCLCYPGEYLKLGTLISYNWTQVFEACDCLKLLSVHFDLCVDATGVVCRQLGLLGTDLHALGCGALCLVTSQSRSGLDFELQKVWKISGDGSDGLHTEEALLLFKLSRAFCMGEGWWGGGEMLKGTELHRLCPHEVDLIKLWVIYALV